MTNQGVQRIHGFCGLCIARCGTIATVEDGRFTRLDPDPDHPTGHAICAKGRAAPELVYHPERLTHPLRRTCPKGDPDPGWERIGWDEALDLTAAAMRRAAERHGPQAVAFTLASGSTTTIGDSAGFIQRLANAFGTPNSKITLDLCGGGRSFATQYTFGVGSLGTGAGGGAMPDIERSGVLILWGYNPSFTRLTHATAVVAGLKRGMRLVVVDPRHVGLAGKADQWLRVRPGMDGALALGLAHVMIERGWYDRDFIREWSNGPHLVRADTGRLLTERDLRPDGEAGRLVAWDSAAARPVSYDTSMGRYDGDSGALALEKGYAPLPEFSEPPVGPVARPDLAARFPLVLTSAKSSVFCQTQHRGLPSLRKRARDPEVELHPAAAKACAVADGDWVAIETSEGSVRARARLNADLDPRVAVGEHGFWQACGPLGVPGHDPFGPASASYNLLIGTAERDPVSGTPALRSYLCEIRRLPEGDTA